MFKLFENIVEAVYWLLIFLSPTIVAGVIAIWVHFKFGHAIVVPLIIGSIGFVGGILLAEWIRRKYGCSNFYGRLKRTGGDEPSSVRRNGGEE